MVGIIYGSNMGNTKDVANLISKHIGVENVVVDVAEIKADDLLKFTNFIIGTSTWGDGKLQDDWLEFDFENLQIKGKKVAIFGVGDSSSYGDTFCDGMKELYDKFTKAGASIVGNVSSDGYEFKNSKAIIDGKFVGLALDNDNQADLTNNRVIAWCNYIKENFI